MKFSGDLVLAVMDEDGESQLYSSILEINQIDNSWKAGVPTISMQKNMNDSSGKMQRLRLNIQMPGV